MQWTFTCGKENTSIPRIFSFNLLRRIRGSGWMTANPETYPFFGVVSLSATSSSIGALFWILLSSYPSLSRLAMCCAPAQWQIGQFAQSRVVVNWMVEA